ncbi:MAG: N-formylglutamate amidohydrolase [Pseudomonadota bacterium]
MNLPDQSELDDCRAASVILVPGQSVVRLFSEHAGHRIPTPWQDLGLDRALLLSHFGVDIGAADITHLLADQTGAPAALARYSRLFLDYNRSPSHWDFARPDLAGIPVPGNLSIDNAEHAARRYVAGEPLELALRLLLATPGVLMTIHSFTRWWDGERRSVDIGITCAHNHPLIDGVSDYFARTAPDLGLRYGRDTPYAYNPAYANTLTQHTSAAGQIGFQVEICNDVTASPEQMDAMLTLLTGAVQWLEVASTDAGVGSATGD